MLQTLNAQLKRGLATGLLEAFLRPPSHWWHPGEDARGPTRLTGYNNSPTELCLLQPPDGTKVVSVASDKGTILMLGVI